MLEAAAAGKPIISTDVGGASMAIDRDRSGFIVANDGDITKLANAMVESADPERHRQLNKAARWTGARIFRWDR